MTFNANNFNWTLVTDADFPNDTVYESSFTLKKYQDLNNKTQKEISRVFSRANADSGDITFLTKGKDGTETKIQTRSKNGVVNIFNDSLNTQYFSESDLDTMGQYEGILADSRQKIIGENFDKFFEGTDLNMDYWGSDFESDVNNWQIDTELPAFAENTSNRLEGEKIFSDINNYESAGSPVDNSKTFLRYPLTEVPNFGYDFIRIRSFKYTPGGRSSLSLGAGRLSAKERLIKNSTPIETVVLPMQPNFSESNAVQWGGDMISPIQMLGAKAAAGGIEAVSKLIGFDGGGAGGVLGNTVADLTTDLQNVIKDSETGPAIIAYFAGQAVGANILGRSAGITFNPNLELLFKGPNLRTFNFNFRFTPRSEEEAREVKQIIRCFKKNMAVQRSTSNLFLKTPNIFTLEYIYNSTGENAGQLHPYLNMFKPMAMTSFNVNYTPDGSYMTYGDGSLTQYDVQMAFGEIEPIYADEFDSELSGDSDVGAYSDHANMGY